MHADSGEGSQPGEGGSVGLNIDQDVEHGEVGETGLGEGAEPACRVGAKLATGNLVASRFKLPRLPPCLLRAPHSDEGNVPGYAIDEQVQKYCCMQLSAGLK
jgi:hypothetical protein